MVKTWERHNTATAIIRPSSYPPIHHSPSLHHIGKLGTAVVILDHWGVLGGMALRISTRQAKALQVDYCTL